MKSQTIEEEVAFPYIKLDGNLNEVIKIFTWEREDQFTEDEPTSPFTKTVSRQATSPKALSNSPLRGRRVTFFHREIHLLHIFFFFHPMSCSNHHSNFSRKPRMSVLQVWKRKTPLPKSSSTCHNDSPPPPRNTHHSISPPMDYRQRDRIINQLHTISTLIDSQTPTPPSSPYPLV
ncbi:hypothetical protein Tco_1391605 [Tanacetum coccineum]